jgi:hypothetical protein
MIGQLPNVAPRGRVGRARPGLRPGARAEGAGNLGRRRAETDRVNARHDCRVNQLALQEVVAWHRDTHGEPAAAEQDVPAVQGMLTVGSAIRTPMRASRPHVEPPRRTRRPEPRYPRRT